MLMNYMDCKIIEWLQSKEIKQHREIQCRKSSWNILIYDDYEKKVKIHWKG